MTLKIQYGGSYHGNQKFELIYFHINIITTWYLLYVCNMNVVSWKLWILGSRCSLNLSVKSKSGDIAAIMESQYVIAAVLSLPCHIYIINQDTSKYYRL